jgi:hypothetical protein
MTYTDEQIEEAQRYSDEYPENGRNDILASRSAKAEPKVGAWGYPIEESAKEDDA